MKYEGKFSDSEHTGVRLSSETTDTCNICHETKYTKFYGRLSGQPICRACYAKMRLFKRTGSVKRNKVYDWGW